ncbi:MAG: hypothetical protein AABX47_02610 [Nanoarchaeota archaeon]
MPLNKPHGRRRTLTDIILEGASFLKEAAKTGIYAANPINDAYRFGSSAAILFKSGVSSIASCAPAVGSKSLNETVSEGLKLYKDHLKQGSFLGGENSRNVLLYGGLFASGLPVYVPLLASRFALGFTAHACKSAVRHASTYAPIPDAWRQRLDEMLGDDENFRKNILPPVLEAAIALKSYGGIVSSKWVAGAVESIGSYIKGSNETGARAFLGNIISRPARFIKTMLADYLSFSVAKGGLVKAESLDEKIKRWSDPATAAEHPIVGNLVAGNLGYFARAEFANDLKSSAVQTLVETKDGIVKAIDSVITPDNISNAISSAGNAVSYIFDGRLVNDVSRLHNYLYSGDALRDAKEQCIRRGEGFSSDMKYSAILLKQIALSNLGDAADYLRINPSERYAIVITGSNDTFIQNMEINAISELGKQGVEQSHLILLKAHNISEDAIRQAFKETGQKMDWNDKLVTLLFAHGQQNVELVDDGKIPQYKNESYAFIERTGEQFTERDLRAAHKLVPRGFGVTITTPCHGGTFAGGSTENIYVITSSASEAAWSTHSGKDFTIRMLESAKGASGIYDYVKDPIGLWRLAQRAAYSHNQNSIRDQRPQAGFNGRSDDVRRMGN